jgi:hypothetical protein
MRQQNRRWESAKLVILGAAWQRSRSRGFIRNNESQSKGAKPRARANQDCYVETKE